MEKVMGRSGGGGYHKPTGHPSTAAAVGIFLGPQRRRNGENRSFDYLTCFQYCSQ